MEGWAKAAEAGFTGEPHNPNLQPWSDTVCPPSAGRRTPKSAKANPSHVAEWTETQGGMSEILNQAAQERLLAGCGQGGLAPQVRQAPADLGEGSLEIGADHERDDVNGVPPGGERGFGLAQVAQRLLPTPLEFGRDQAVIRIDLIELPLGQGGSVAQALNLLRLSVERRLVG